MSRVFYYNADDIYAIQGVSLFPYEATPLKQIVEDEAGFDLTNYPVNLNSDIVKDLWQRIIARYNDDYIFRIVIKDNVSSPSQSEATNEFYKWLTRVMNFIAQTYEYYSTLLGVYAGAKASLMEDIKATSKNKVKFNDTPQNPNNLGVYEGDDYITHFTSTEGETSSPLMSKMMRLKEIQDHYKDLMEDWVDKASKLFIEEANV